MGEYYSKQNEPKLGRTLYDDIRRGDFKETIKRDYKEFKEFYISEENRARLKEMGWFKRFFRTNLWLLKSLFFKLNPTRRLLLVLSIIISFSSLNSDTGNVHVQILGNNFLGFLLLLFILMLELKDKLLARDELEEGRAVQMALMPERKPEIPGWSVWLYTRPANEVGGDMVDYLKINGDRYGFALGDVAGKGLRAALLMAKLQSTLRALATEYSSLGELGKKLNTIFHRDSLPNIFASLIYFELRPDSNKISLLNAGHMPPMILKNGEVTELPKGSPALGISDIATFSEKDIEIADSEVLVVYSDGVTEARNELGDFLGENRLKAMLKKLGDHSPEKVGETILNYVEHFVGNARYHDDLSLIILRRNSV